MARRSGRDERGSMAVEIVILTPVLMMFVLLVVAFGRYVAAEGDIEATARDAARAASMELSRSAAQDVAQRVVATSLDADTDCAPPEVSGTWAPGGEISVSLDCRVSYEGLGLIGVPGSVNIDTTSSVPLDPYRRYE